jgi:Methylmalonyl-CoA mutase
MKQGEFAESPSGLPPPRLSVQSATGIDVPTHVGPEAVHDENIGSPGAFPFTRGIFADGYQGRMWTIRQYSGFGTAGESNERYKFLLAQGQTGLSVALDLPTQCGYDPTHPMARPEIGKVGVSLSNLSEAEILFRDLDLSKISTSFTINGTAAIVYAMYLAVADKVGVPRGKLTGTIQNDILKEYVARGTWIFPVKPSMRLVADSILYSNDVSPRFNPISSRHRARSSLVGTAISEQSALWTRARSAALSSGAGAGVSPQPCRRSGLIAELRSVCPFSSPSLTARTLVAAHRQAGDRRLASSESASRLVSVRGSAYSFHDRRLVRARMCSPSRAKTLGARGDENDQARHQWKAIRR